MLSFGPHRICGGAVFLLGRFVSDAAVVHLRTGVPVGMRACRRQVASRAIVTLMQSHAIADECWTRSMIALIFR